MAARSKNDSKSPIKLQDIASDAEVSIATVSLALRDDPSITEETKRRVLEAKKRLGYSPLRKRIKTTPPVIVHPPESGCNNILYCIVGFPIRKIQYAGFLDGVMSACSERKIRVEVKSIQSEELLSEELLLLDKVDGVVLTGDFQTSTVDFFLKSCPNLILLGNYPYLNTHRVEIDVFGMGESTAKRLVEDGHKHIVHLLRFPKNYYERQFLMGLRDGLEVQGLSLPASNILQVPDLVDSVSEVARKILEMSPVVTAVTSHATNIAEACLTEARLQQGTKSGKRIKDGMTGYAVGMVSNERVTPGLHILDPGLDRAGWLAVERLCQLYQKCAPFPFATVINADGWQGG